jgi:ribulose-phosphate 3-epimerase
MKAIYPSLISADLLNLGSVIKTLDPYCAGYHLDVMDNHFVPNLTWGPAFINALAAATNRPSWVHLMIDNPEAMINQLQLPKGSLVSIHIENNSKIKQCLNRIKENGWLTGITLSPKTPVGESLPFLDLLLDQILIMAVEPGFSGQKFLPQAVGRVAQLAYWRQEKGLSFRIGIDGGVNENNIVELATVGVDDLAIATGIFGQADPVAALKRLCNLIK